MCRRLEDFFDSRGENFVDPDEEREIDESELSEFIYDLPEGFDSDEANEQDIDYLDEDAIEVNEIRGLVDDSGYASLLSSAAISPR